MILEIRTYRLHPGTRDEFVRIMAEESVPLLRQAGIDVVGCGPSLVSEDEHEEAYLLRAFASAEKLQAQEEQFYASDAWRQGPREAIVSRIMHYHSIAVELTAEAIETLRQG